MSNDRLILQSISKFFVGQLIFTCGLFHRCTLFRYHYPDPAPKGCTKRDAPVVFRHQSAPSNPRMYQLASTSLFPPIPPFDQLHPLVIHFPIALVLVAPVVIALALAWHKHTKVLLVVATLLMAMASAAAVVAVQSGKAASGYAENVPGAGPVLDAHATLGTRARNATLALTGALALGTAMAWRGGEKLPRKFTLIGGGAYLAIHAAGALVVANAAHEGGRLVHEFGVRAWPTPLAPTPPASTPPALTSPTTSAPGSGILAPAPAATAKASGLVKAMEQSAEHAEKLTNTSQNGWTDADLAKSPDDDAKAIAQLMTGLLTTERVKAKPAEFREWLTENAALADALAQGIADRRKTAKPTAAELTTRFEALIANCDRCHAKFRD